MAKFLKSQVKRYKMMLDIASDFIPFDAVCTANIIALHYLYIILLTGSFDNDFNDYLTAKLNAI